MSLYGTVGGSSIGPTPGTHPLPSSRKRKERDYDGRNDPNARPNFSAHSSATFLLGLPRSQHVRQPLPPLPLAPPSAEQKFFKQVPYPRPAPATAPTPPAKPGGNRLLMAGYLAHEFLSRGTLFGRPYGTTTAPATRSEDPSKKRKQQYKEVARILWGGGDRGAHVPGVINPTQLGAWLRKLHDK